MRGLRKEVPLDGLVGAPPTGAPRVISPTPFGATSAPGVWVAGNVSDPYGPLVVAAAGGMTAAGQVNGDVVAERSRRAVARRQPERRWSA